MTHKRELESCISLIFNAEKNLDGELFSCLFLILFLPVIPFIFSSLPSFSFLSISSRFHFLLSLFCWSLNQILVAFPVALRLNCKRLSSQTELDIDDKKLG